MDGFENERYGATPYLEHSDLVLIINSLGDRLTELGLRRVFRLLIDIDSGETTGLDRRWRDAYRDEVGRVVDEDDEAERQWLFQQAMAKDD